MDKELFSVDRNAAALAGPKGGFPAQEQDHPGLTSDMEPVPDHGEKTWVGRNRLPGMKALITGGDSG
nr:NAD(P)-dependent dehydrogenase [Actinomycetales bacterium]